MLTGACYDSYSEFNQEGIAPVQPVYESIRMEDHFIVVKNGAMNYRVYNPFDQPV